MAQIPSNGFQKIRVCINRVAYPRPSKRCSDKHSVGVFVHGTNIRFRKIQTHEISHEKVCILEFEHAQTPFLISFDSMRNRMFLSKYKINRIRLKKDFTNRVFVRSSLVNREFVENSVYFERFSKIFSSLKFQYILCLINQDFSASLQPTDTIYSLLNRRYFVELSSNIVNIFPNLHPYFSKYWKYEYFSPHPCSFLNSTILSIRFFQRGATQYK